VELKKRNKNSIYRSRVDIKKNNFQFWGHNCFSVKSKNSALVIDPWFSESGAFYSSWFQYPKNHKFKKNVLELLIQSKKSYIFISHEHQDHFDEKFLSVVPKHTSIIIPNYMDKNFRNQVLEMFENVIELSQNKEYEIDNEIKISLIIKDIGISHDAAILIKTKNYVFFNQNDCKVFDKLHLINEKIDFYSVQFSGANWHPSNFDFPDHQKVKISSQKVKNKFKNVLNALNQLQPKYFLPAAGPAIFPFLDINLSLGVDNIFVHQQELKEFLEFNEFNNILFLRPGQDFTSNAFKPIETPTIEDVKSYRNGIKNYWDNIPNKLDRKLLEDQILKRFSEIKDIKIINCPILIFNYGNTFNNDKTTKNKIFIDLNEKKLLDNFDYSSNFEEIVSTEKYFYLMCIERWQNVYLSLRANVFRKPDIVSNSLNIFLFSDISNIRNNFLSTNEINSEKVIVENKSKQRYIVNRYCPHQKADLCNAEIDEDNNLICPVHAWKFNLNNGGKDNRSNLTINSKKI
tara:strand:- start:793 stop:2340 length:1548 start_codon:yes stop_codon:yes gene_type:complete